MNDSLQRGIAALKAGRRDEARQYLIEAVKQDLDNEQAWSWLYSVANSDKERSECLKQILRINPGHEKAKQTLDRLNNPTQSPFPSNEDSGEGQSAASLPTAARQVSEVKIDKGIQVDREAIIRQQYVAFFLAFVLFIPALEVSSYVFHTYSYGTLIAVAMLTYIGISSIVNQVSILGIRGQKEHTRGNDAVIVGMLAIFMAAADIIMVFAPLLLETFYPLTTTLATPAAPNGFTTAFAIAAKASSIANVSQVTQWVVVLMLCVGIISSAWVSWTGQHQLSKYYALSFAIMTLVGIGWFFQNDKANGSLLRDCARLQALYDSGQYQITEGSVHVLHNQPLAGHEEGDIIDVGATRLVVNYSSATCGYSTTIANGGILTEGTYARFYYADDGAILRIDLRQN